MEHFFTLCDSVVNWAVLSFLAWTTSFVGVGGMVKKVLSINHQQNALLIELGRSHLYAECEQSITMGYRTIKNTEEVSGLFEAYTSLGGNNTGTDIYRQFMKLPLRKDEYRNEN